MTSAPEILKKAAQHIEDRAATRDQVQAGGERSMSRTVAAFNALTGHALSEREGWLFMLVLKVARATNTPTGIPDDYEDAAAYAGLAGEAAARIMRAVAPVPIGEVREVEAAPRREVVIEGVGNVAVPNGYEWVAQDADGSWWAYKSKPSAICDQWAESGENPSACGYRNLSPAPTDSAGNPDWSTTLRQVGA